MAGGLTLKFHDREFKRHLSRATATGLKRAAVHLHSKCRQAVSKPNTGTRVLGGRDARGKFLPGHTVYDNPSQPGESPHLRTGFGRSQIVWEYNGNDKDPAVRVGATLAGIYMIYLELGTRNVEARPWLMLTLMQQTPTLGVLATGGGR